MDHAFCSAMKQLEDGVSNVCDRGYWWSTAGILGRIQGVIIILITPPPDSTLEELRSFAQQPGAGYQQGEQ